MTNLKKFHGLLVCILISCGNISAQKLPCEKLAGFSHIPGFESLDYYTNPSISPDGERLIFLRRIPGKKEDTKLFYESIKEGETWRNPTPLVLINSAKGSFDNGSRVSFSSDGNTIFFHARYQGSQGRDVYYSEFKDGYWQPPLSLGSPINSSDDEFGVWIDEENTLYFTRSFITTDPKSGKGATEVKIFFSKKDNSGNWSQPEKWFPELGFHHTEYPVVFRKGAMLFYATNENEDLHHDYLSVKSGNQWSVPILIDFSCKYGSGISTTYSFNYFVINDDEGDLMQVEVPERLKAIVNSADASTEVALPTTNNPSISNQVIDISNPKFRSNVVPGNRYALVIGNGNYTESPLPNPVNDANAMARELENSGFDVVKFTDISLVEMREAVRNFGDKLNLNNGIGLFYFAGHGIQSRGINYLVPVDADILREYDIEDQCLQADHVLRMMETIRNPMNIVILDACRNNPYTSSFRSVQRGLAQPESAPTGSIVAFATAPGKTAADGDGENGLYTQELIKAIRIPGLSIEGVFKQVRKNVIELSNGEQTPWENQSLTGDFYFQPLEKK